LSISNTDKVQMYGNIELGEWTLGWAFSCRWSLTVDVWL